MDILPQDFGAQKFWTIKLSELTQSIISKVISDRRLHKGTARRKYMSLSSSSSIRKPVS